MMVSPFLPRHACATHPTYLTLQIKVIGLIYENKNSTDDLHILLALR